jgi:hypothetical protein
MGDDGDFSVNLADLADIEAKMPQIRQLLRERRQLLTEKRHEVELLTKQIELLARLIGTKRGQPERARTAPAQDRAVQALEKADVPMGPTSLYKFMSEQGMTVPKDANALGANLWAAWRAGRIRKATNGVYAPLDETGSTEVDRPLTDYAWAAENMPEAPQPAATRNELRPGRSPSKSRGAP